MVDSLKQNKLLRSVGSSMQMDSVSSREPAHIESASAAYSAGHAIADLFQLLKTERRDFFVMIVYSIVIGGLALIVPVVVQMLVDTIAFGSVIQPVIVLTGCVFVALALSQLVSLMQLVVLEYLQRRLFVRVAIALAQRLPRITAAASRNETAAELINRFFEVVLVQKLVSKIALDGTAVTLQLIIGVTILSLYHPIFFFYSFVLLLFLYAIFRFLGIGAAHTAIKESSAKHSVFIWLENIVENPLLFKSAPGAELGVRWADDYTHEYLRCRAKHFKHLFRQFIGVSLMYVFGSAGLLGIGGALVLNEQLSIGQLVAAELIVTAMLTGLLKLGRVLESFYDLVGSLSKLDSLFSMPLESSAGDVIPGDTEKPIALELKNISIAFNAEQRPLQGVSLKVTEGTIVAVYGTNGSGKSVLADVLSKFLDASSGSVEFNGLPMQYIAPASIRNRVLLVRDPEVFRGTIRENLTLGVEYPASTLRQILQEVALLEGIEQLPMGLETRIAENGRPLSSGQTLRLMVARCLLTRPGLLILDETLDQINLSVVKDAIIPALRRRSSSTTVLVLTHQEEIAGLCDSSSTLCNGKLEGGCRG
jgi:putative ABC transport system ATP-binding protein